MGIYNTRYAAVNLSSTTINVYETLVRSERHTGSVTAGGAVIGKIYPNEFYIVTPNESPYWTHFRIFFRDASGQGRYGYIETSPGVTLDDYSWNAYQYPYHYYNTSGNGLVESEKTVPINGVVHRVFTAARNVAYRSPNGDPLGTIPAGTQLACQSSTTGQTYTDYMVFYYKKNSGGSWTKMNATVDYAFVDLDIENGSMPYNRAIR